ncbi:MAG: hypothetical protein ACJ79V_19535, partial [Myxococcales bacterium]
MELSRFVLTYRGVRPGEHVLYSVLDDRYVGIDDATLEAIGRWSRGSLPANAEENDAYEALSEDGFLVEDRSADDERLGEHLDRARGGV